MHRHRSAGWPLALLAALIVLVSGLPATAAGRPQPSLAVEPSTELVDGQLVAVTGSGFPPGQYVGLALCATGSAALRCDDSHATYALPDEAGSFTTDLVLDAVFLADEATTTATVDCRASTGACAVAAYTEDGVSGAAPVATAPVSFEPDAPLRPPPVLTATPAAGLVDGQAVVLTGTGFDAGYALVRQCAAGAGTLAACATIGGQYISGDVDEGGEPGGAGEVSGSLLVDVAIATLDGQIVDCRTPGACELLAGDPADPTALARVALAFDPAAPFVAPPALAVSPPAELVDRQSVAVTGSGFRPDYYVSFSVCRSPLDDYRDCDSGGDYYAETDVTGSFSSTLVLDAAFLAGDGDVVDCRTSDFACVLLATNDVESAVLGLHFDPDAPLAPAPVLLAAPETGLVDGQVVAVTGSGFQPESFVALQQCTADALDTRGCTWRGYADTDATGSFSTKVSVLAAFEAAGGTRVNCRSAPGRCQLVAGRVGDPGEAGVVPLVFDPSAPLRPPPVLTVEPATDLVDGQVVTLTGTGFLPFDDDITVAQCRARWDGPDDCDTASVYSQVAEDGTFTVTLALDAVLRTDGGEVDCRTASQGCVVVVGDLYGDSGDLAEAPLAFDPDAPLLPPPVLTVAPSTDLAAQSDVEVVLATGQGFEPFTFVQLQQCAAADTIEGCDLDQTQYLSVDEAGAFAQSVSLAATLTTPAGEAIDCRSAPGACVLIATAFEDDGEDGDTISVALGFAPPPPPRGRYLDQIFANEDIEVLYDVVYGSAIDVDGNPIELTLDLYRPTGDAVAARPAVIWMHGGYFAFGEKSSMAAYARDLARRGYVTASISYRLRPNMVYPAGPELLPAAEDAQEDAATAVQWLRDNATTYGVDTRAISFGGYSAGAVTSLNLAYGPDLSAGESSGIAAAVSLAGVRFFGAVEAGEPPLLMFHGTEDTVVPYGAGASVCEEVLLAGVLCELVTYQGIDHGLSSFNRDVGNRTADFLAEHVLAPLGLVTAGGSSPDG